MTAGRVGKPHGHDGSFYVEAPCHPFALGSEVRIGASVHDVTRRAGTDERPLIRLSDLADPRQVRGEPLLVEAELRDDEWLAVDLVGSAVPGHGRVRRVLDGPSCSVLELEDGRLVPFVRDAIRLVEGGRIVLNEDFLA